MATLKGKVAVVTGASKGIGAAIAEKLAAEGASVVVNYAQSADGANKVVARIQKKGGRAIAVQADVSKVDQSKSLFEKSVKEFGKVDVLVNNAGVYEFQPLGNIYEDHYSRLFDINVKGLIFATQEAVRIFGDNGGSVVNISSVVSPSPMANASVYSATKAAVDAVTKALSKELGPKNIRVNSVLPGATETEGFDALEISGDIRKWAVSITPLGRLGKPEDISGLVAFLASDESAWVTGEIIRASGGQN